MNSFNFQIVPVANLAAIVTPFPDHICYFTEDTENYYIWENNAIKEIFVDTSSLTWNNITNKPTTISGFGITDAVKANNGTLNFLAKFTPDGTTIGNSQIIDDGTNLGINVSPNTTSKLWVKASTSQHGIRGEATSAGNAGLYGFNYTTASTGSNIGVVAEAQGNTSTNIGLQATASGSSVVLLGAQIISTTSDTNTSIGAQISAVGNGSKYALQLLDGSQGTGKYLKSTTVDGKANWANINIAEVTNGLSSTLLGAPNGIATLDSNSKLVMSQMPISVMDYKGTYDIVTNTPTLADGTGNQGDVYACTTTGTRTFGVGNTLTVNVGEWLIYNGTKWEKTPGNTVGSGTVTSVGISLGTTGTDVNISNSPITSSGNINLNIPTASASARGLLSTADWTTFNNKVDASINTLGFVARFVGSNLIGNAALQDNGSTAAIGALPTSSIVFRVGTTSLQTGLEVNNSFNSVTDKFGINVTSGGTGTGKNTSIYALAQNSTVQNTGLDITAQGSSTLNIGGKFTARQATNNHALQLVDGTEIVAGRFLKNIVDGKANWANITVADVSGAVGAVGGTNNYIAKFTPNGTTIGNSKIVDNGTNIYIDDANAIGYAASKFYISSSNTDQILKLDMLGSTANSPIGIELNMSFAPNIKAGTVSGCRITSRGSSTENRGIELLVNNTTLGKNIGIFVNAGSGAGGNYSAQLQDGTETSTGGKYLKDMGDGKANWTYLPDSAQIMCSDMINAITADASNPKAIWAAPCNGQLTDAFATLRIPQSGGATFTVLVKSSLVTLATLTFSNGNLQFMSTNPTATQTFTKGDIFEFYVSQVGDGTARSLLVTLNYLRT